MIHYLSRLGLLAYFSIVLMALFFLTGSMKNLWVAANTISIQNQTMMAEIQTNFPTLADELNAIEPAAQ